MHLVLITHLFILLFTILFIGCSGGGGGDDVVEDEDNQQDIAEFCKVDVLTAEITGPERTTYTIGETFTLTGSGKDPTIGCIEEKADEYLIWTTDAYGRIGEGMSVDVETADVAPGTYLITLTVSNEAGETTTDTITIELREPDAVLDPEEFGSIQEALDNALPGEIIQLKAKTYEESIVVRNEDITIQGQGTGSTILRGDGTQPVITNSSMTGTSLNLTIRGLAIENGHTGIDFGRSDNFTLEDCLIRGNRENGIFTMDVNGLTIRKCTIMSNGQSGIYFNRSEATIANSRVADNGRDGITIASSDAAISNSIVNSNGRLGILITSGTQLEDGTLPVSSASISYCTVDSNSGGGINLYQDAGPSSIEKSILSLNTLTGIIQAKASGLSLNNILFWQNGCDWSNAGECQSNYDPIISVAGKDPLYVDGTNYDFHLQAGSPALTDFGEQIGAYGNGGTPP